MRRFKYNIFCDKFYACLALRKMLQQLDPSFTYNGSADNMSTAREMLMTSGADLIFADVELSDGKTYDLMAQADVSTPVILISPFASYERNVPASTIDILQEPVSSDNLSQSLKKFRKLV